MNFWKILSNNYANFLDGKLSDEPQEATIVGNVSKLAVTPPGYEGNIKKGHLVFDACFESG